MIRPSLATVAAPRADLGTRLVGVAMVTLWLGVALFAQGTRVAVPAMLAAAGSAGWLVWLLRERRRAQSEQALACSSGDALVADTALFDAALASDVEQLLARGAALFGASHAWLHAEAEFGAQSCAWPSSGTSHPTALATQDPPWWQAPLTSQPVWLSDSAMPARCAVVLRQGEMRVGVLAFECAIAQRPYGGREAQWLTALSVLLTHMLLLQHLQHALAEVSDQSARERRMFLSNLSHKLRTPMTAVLGFAQILDLDDSLNAEHHQFVREIEAAGRALLDMLNELVGIARE